MSKPVFLAELYQHSVSKLTANREEWQGLLSGMARYYKYSFDNNVLIYAQCPDAGLLATFDVWNEKIGRRINRGAKSIAVIDMASPIASLKYLFDLNDTNGDHDTLKRVLSMVWEVEPQYRPSLLIRFHDKHGTTTSNIESSIFELIQQHLDTHLPKYMNGFSVTDPDNMLYSLPIGAVWAEFTKILRDSVTHVVFAKCGLNNPIHSDSSFENISHFNSLDLFMRLGSATMSIVRSVLREISTEIEQIKIERSKIYEQATVNELQLHRGQGRPAVSKYSSFGERADRHDTGGQVRQGVEGIHDGEPSG